MRVGRPHRRKATGHRIRAWCALSITRRVKTFAVSWIRAITGYCIVWPSQITITPQLNMTLSVIASFFSKRHGA